MKHSPRLAAMQEDELCAGIREVEAHLARIAGDDDSACGKARIRLFESLLQEQRARLSELRAVHHDRCTSQDYL
jgi:hypothetical protein